MRWVLLVAALAQPALAEQSDEEHIVGDRKVSIARIDPIEILTIGPSDHEQSQVLSGAEVEIAAFLADADSVALLGQPVLVAEVTGTHSCDEGDPRAYWVVTLGDIPAPEGPVTTCAELTVSLTPGAVVLEADPGGEGGEAWSWTPGKGWASAG